MIKANPHIGSSFEAFLEEDGLAEAVNSVGIKRTLALQIAEEMRKQNITKAEMTRRMKTSASQLNRLLDPDNDRIQLDTLVRAANAVNKSLSVSII